MWRATIKGLIAHKLRLVLTALAVVLGVAFVSGTYVLTDTLGHTFDQLFSQVNQGVAVPVRASNAFGDARQRVPDTLVEKIQGVEGVARAVGIVQGYAQVVDKKGKPITTGGAPTFGLNWVDAPENPLSLLRLLLGQRLERDRRGVQLPSAPVGTGVEEVVARAAHQQDGRSPRPIRHVL